MKEQIPFEDLENNKIKIKDFSKINKLDKNSNITINNKIESNSDLRRLAIIPQLRSDAFPEGYNKKIYEIKKDGNQMKTFHYIELADIHKILDENAITLDKEMIYYQKIPTSFLRELKILHNEWFPVEYSYDYILKYLEGRSDYFNIGAFTKIRGIEHIVGCILFKYESDGKFSDAINDDSIRRSCLSRLCNPKYAGYISTIGVIDEIRGIGVGKNLLSKAISILKMRKSCLGIYLHVIKHNNSAINFYTSNEFCRGKYFENFYYIHNNYYDCIVFYKLFDPMKIKTENLYRIKEKNEKMKYHIISNLDDK